MRRTGPALPRRTEHTLREAQDAITIAIMLDQSAVETPIGAVTHFRLPSGGSASFPSALIEHVKRRRRYDAVAAAQEPGQDGVSGEGR